MASGVVKKSGTFVRRIENMITDSLEGNKDHDISFASYIDTSTEVLDAILCVGAVPQSTWNTTLQPMSPNFSSYKFRFRALGTTGQTYSINFVLFYHLKNS